MIFHEAEKDNPELQDLIETANELFSQQPNALLLGVFTLVGVFLGKYYTIIVAGEGGQHLIKGILSYFPKTQSIPFLRINAQLILMSLKEERLYILRIIK